MATSDIAIRVEGLGKQYRIGKLERYRTLRDSLTETVAAPFRRARQMVRSISSGSAGAKAESPSETIWALKDVSFEVPRGAVVGVIGRNGAGKSTLLKILSRITEPTEGHVEIRGRVGSLLEVGTGFHGELSGRENIYLNGAILGMRRAEIVRKFDEIVAFAEVEKFIDTPVKHYSSGMYMRLAFAVAAHMEPEILIVDEVLAVGDAQFQKKCLGKMGDVAREGRTVLLVSHNMSAISSLCGTGLLLDSGVLAGAGPTQACIDKYYVSLGDRARGSGTTERPKNASGETRIVAVRLSDRNGEARQRFCCGEDIAVELTVEGISNFRSFLCAVIIRTTTGVSVLHVPSPPEFSWRPLNPAGISVVRCEIPNCGLFPGTYVVSVWLGRSAFQEVDRLSDALTFSVEQGRLDAYGFDMSWSQGLYFCESRWTQCGLEEVDCAVDTSLA